eukprot:COSAG01_NODE_49607_length_370_cov_12.214022_1_plen_79_part_10
MAILLILCILCVTTGFEQVDSLKDSIDLLITHDHGPQDTLCRPEIQPKIQYAERLRVLRRLKVCTVRVRNTLHDIHPSV